MILKPVCKIVLVCMISFLVPNNVYVALQMFDQVAVINMDSLQQIDMIDIVLNEDVGADVRLIGTIVIGSGICIADNVYAFFCSSIHAKKWRR